MSTETFSFDCEKMKWKKLEVKGNKPIAMNSCGLCAVGEKLVIFGGSIPHSDREELLDGVQIKQYITLYGYNNDCWEFDPCEGIGNVLCIVCEMMDAAGTETKSPQFNFIICNICAVNCQ